MPALSTTELTAPLLEFQPIATRFTLPAVCAPANVTGTDVWFVCGVAATTCTNASGVVVVVDVVTGVVVDDVDGGTVVVVDVVEVVVVVGGCVVVVVVVVGAPAALNAIICMTQAALPYRLAVAL